MIVWAWLFTAPTQLCQLLLTGAADCLAKHSYNEDKCRAQVDALYECCNAMYEQRGDKAQSASCPKATLLRLKLKQRAQESSR